MTYPVGEVVLCGILILLAIVVLVILKQRKAIQQSMMSKIEMFQKAFDVSEEAILVLSDDNRIWYANKALLKLFSLSEDALGRPLDPVPQVKIKREWIPLDRFVREKYQENGRKLLSFPQSSLLLGEYDQQSIPVNLYIDRVHVGHMHTKWYSLIAIHDLRKEYERSQVAYRHRLTNLPNQIQAKSDLNKLFSKIHLHNKKLALVLIEIDNFSHIRAIIGYEQSEQILVHFGQYLERITKENSYYVYHTFSNHFLICMPVIDTISEAVFFSKEIQRELGTFYKINGVPFHLTASIGISVYPDSGSTLNLMDRAYKALIEAGKTGYGKIDVYYQDESTKKYDELELFNAVHEAIEKNEFEVYYQPIVRAKDKEVVAAEALIRWRHGEYGFISPDIFIPMLEKSGFIIELGRFVLSEVLKQQKRWELFKFKPIEISINMSLLEIESEGFLENVKQQLAEHQVAPELIKFEITEGAAMKNEAHVDRQLYELKKIGVSVSLDDFGTGYTSFAYLKKFPADILKIDKTLIDYIVDNEDDQRIVKAMIELGHNIGMKIVVEGIENQAMAELIGSYGCDYMQGYHFGKPLPAYEFQELIRR